MEEERGKERKGKEKRKEIMHMPSKKIVHASFFIYIFFVRGRGREDGKGNKRGGSGKNFREGRKGKRRHKETKQERGGKNVMLITGTTHAQQTGSFVVSR